MEQQKYNALLYRLKRRFDKHYEEYIDDVSGLCKEQIIEAACEIAAVKETFTEMYFWLEMSEFLDGWGAGISEDDAVYLLSLENPLKELAMKWWLYNIGNKPDFQDFYNEQKSVYY